MTVAHINALELLGKQVSFVYKQDEHSFDCEGLITDVVFSISGESQISINHDDFYNLSDLFDLKVC